MKFQTHNDDPTIDPFNTQWLMTTIQATRRELTKAFGQPLEGGDGKVNHQWFLRFDNGAVCTIYDWKKPEVDEDTNLTWNIGGDLDTGGKTGGSLTSLVHNAFREAHGLQARSAA